MFKKVVSDENEEDTSTDFYIIIIPIGMAIYFYTMYMDLYINAEKQGNRYIINLWSSIIIGLFGIVLYILYIRELILKRKGYVREKVYITHCPYCGYEFKYGVSKYCPNCHHRIWRPYRWVWVKKEKIEEDEGEYLKIERRNG